MGRESDEQRLERMSRYERDLWDEGLELVCGVDEAGRGPLAGPVAAAALVLPRGRLVPGVNDSKKVSPKKRETLFDAIREEAVAVSVGIVDSETIDRINILRATLLAMRRAVLGMEHVPECVLVDALTIPGIKVRQVALVGGDENCHSIAAASIVAKVTRDRIMVEQDGLYPEYGFRQHKGYGTEQHMEALRRYGISPIHRCSFAPVERTVRRAMGRGRSLQGARKKHQRG